MLKGVCHCGSTGWTADIPFKSATACNCTICSRYGALWAYGSLDHDIHEFGPSESYIRQDGGEIEFKFCKECGCLTHYVVILPNGDGRRRAAVNLRMAEDPSLIQEIAIRHFDGRETFTPLPSDGRCVKDMWF